MNKIIQKINQIAKNLNQKNVQHCLAELVRYADKKQFRNIVDNAMITQKLTYAPSELVLLRNQLTTQELAHDAGGISYFKQAIQSIQNKRPCYVNLSNYTKPVTANQAMQGIEELKKELARQKK